MVAEKSQNIEEMLFGNLQEKIMSGIKKAEEDERNHANRYDPFLIAIPDISELQEAIHEELDERSQDVDF